MSQINQVHNFTRCFFEIFFNITLSSKPKSPQVHKIKFMYFHVPLHECYISRPPRLLDSITLIMSVEKCKLQILRPRVSLSF